MLLFTSEVALCACVESDLANSREARENSKTKVKWIFLQNPPELKSAQQMKILTLDSRRKERPR